MFKLGKICNFVQSTGLFNLVACRFNFQERVSESGSKLANVTKLPSVMVVV